VRGEGTNILIAQSSAATIVMETLPTEREQVRVRGQIADETSAQVRWTDAFVEVRRAGTLVAAAVVDDMEGFSFGPITRGETEVRVTVEGGPSIVVEGLVL
jgi:hypothetical protein